MGPASLWKALLIGCLFSIAVETPVLLISLSARHSWRRRLFAGVWLTACSYPVVCLVLPFFFRSETTWKIVAEMFAPVSECTIFWLAFVNGLPRSKAVLAQDFAAIVLANLASFGLGEVFLAALIG